MTDTTDKADSLLCPTDVLQQQHLVTGGESSSGSNSSADTPVSFWNFLQKLDDVNWCKNPFLVKERRENGNEFNMSKALYQEGIDKLLKTTFASPDDALDSLRAVLSRSFRELSIKAMVSKTSEKPQRVVCRKEKVTKEKDGSHVTGRGSIRTNINFGDDLDKFKQVCCWRACIKKSDAGSGFIFTEISDIHQHAQSCFMGCGYKHRKLIQLVSECKDPLKQMAMNVTIYNKIGYTIGKEAISKHNYFKKVVTNEQEITEYSKCLDLGLIGTTGIPLPLELEDEDKAVVGLLCSFKKRGAWVLVLVLCTHEENRFSGLHLALTARKA